MDDVVVIRLVLENRNVDFQGLSRADSKSFINKETLQLIKVVGADDIDLIF